MSIVGRSERSDLRHGNQNINGHVGGRYARSDLQVLASSRMMSEIATLAQTNIITKTI